MIGKFCPQCAVENDREAETCDNCGAVLRVKRPSYSTSSNLPTYAPPLSPKPAPEPQIVYAYPPDRSFSQVFLRAFLAIILTFGSGMWYWYNFYWARTYQVEVTGTAGLPFTGAIGGLRGIKTVEGRVPATFTIRDTIPSITFQKDLEGLNFEPSQGVLAVAIKHGNRTLSETSTSAAFGCVSLTVP